MAELFSKMKAFIARVRGPSSVNVFSGDPLPDSNQKIEAMVTQDLQNTTASRLAKARAKITAAHIVDTQVSVDEPRIEGQRVKSGTLPEDMIANIMLAHPGVKGQELNDLIRQYIDQQ